MTLTIQVNGLEELKRKLSNSELVEPEITTALSSTASSLGRGGTGLGAQRNSISVAGSPLGATGQRISSTRKWPRTSGRAWTKKNVQIFNAKIPGILKRVAEGIKARWAR